MSADSDVLELAVVEDEVADRPHRRVVEDLAEDSGLLGLPGGVRPAWCLVCVEGSPDSRVVGQVQACRAAAEEVAVFGHHAGPVGGGRRGGVGGVARQGDPALGARAR